MHFKIPVLLALVTAAAADWGYDAYTAHGCKDADDMSALVDDGDGSGCVSLGTGATYLSLKVMTPNNRKVSVYEDSNCQSVYGGVTTADNKGCFEASDAANSPKHIGSIFFD
ncbi:hypothetical protein N7481_000581 [Penicillium waksmanii]|uniref:uncharacterized protein n=1 Tax=Penicillium waksmanii TaxID=69791 RepID=UPI002548DAC1|nr:uncharacterized protein N7481_000581 [Penicillium waksmanii]KAJ6000172.1 hypothetical protein N7481_000581 [Penicillium waksmanii]